MKSRKLSLLGVVSLAALAGAIVGYSVEHARAAGIPATTALTYSGVLTDASGVPLTGSKNIQIQLSDMTGAVACTVGPTAITLKAGSFSLPLLDACTTAVHANPDLWVEVFADGSSLGRTKLGAVPYAVEAAHAKSADSTGTVANVVQFNQSGYTSCQPITNFSTAGWNNILMRAALYTDSGCTQLADQSPGACHLFCASEEVADPAHFSGNCCGVATYYTTGIVTVLQYK